MRTVIALLLFALASNHCFSQTTDTSDYPNIRNQIKDQAFFLKMNPKNTNALLKHSYYSQAIGDYETSIKDLNTLLELTPSDYRAMNSRAVAKGAQKKITKEQLRIMEMQ
ncbi:MAG: hypothetical protein IPH89_12905 [Bacteroidetes bacterium]|nr:hypothetical protein [Bacteroidota bacterium]